MDGSSVEVIASTDESVTTIINIVGIVTILSAEKLLAELKSAFKNSKKVSLDLSGVTEVDLAGMQLLCSAHRSSIFNNIEFSVVRQNRCLWEVAEASGHIRLNGCDQDSKNTCIWIKENHPS